MESNNQQVEHRAAEWLARRDGPVWTHQDEAAMKRWLDESASNTVAFLRLQAAWQKADRFKVLGAGLPRGSVPPRQKFNFSPVFESPVKPAKAFPRFRQRYWLIAASLAVVLLGVAYAWPWGHAYSTPVGGLASVPMEDGSKVTLNTNSRIRVVLNHGERRVKLERGEAFFEVVSDPARPFVVDTGGKRVVVLGTQFSVRQDTGATQVVVTEGKIRIQNAEGEADAFDLPAGGVAQMDGSGTQVQSRPVPELLERLSWRLGFVAFQNVSLAEAVAEFNRYNQRKIVIADPTSPALGAIRLEGKFKATNVRAFIRLLEEAYPVTAEDHGRRIVLKGK